MRQHKYEYDAFISHAVEDKIPIANELCAKLERAGLKIWYSGKELGVGDSIEKTIERGLNRSRYGIVIFSPTYLAKNWTIREFYTLLAKEIEEQKVILPVLYNITLDELKNKDLVMADRFAVNSDKGLDFVVERLLREIKKPQVLKKKQAWFTRIWLVLILSLLVNVTLLVNRNSVHSEHTPVRNSLPVEQGAMNLQAANYSNLLGEMQGLLKRISTCSCDHGGQNTPPSLYTTDSEDDPDSWRLPVYSQQAANRHEAAYRPQRNKVTMAVFFHMETGDQQERGPDQTFHTVSLDKEAGSFVTATNHNRHGDLRKGVCAHSLEPGD